MTVRLHLIWEALLRDRVKIIRRLCSCAFVISSLFLLLRWWDTWNVLAAALTRHTLVFRSLAGYPLTTCSLWCWRRRRLRAVRHWTRYLPRRPLTKRSVAVSCRWRGSQLRRCRRGSTVDLVRCKRVNLCERSSGDRLVWLKVQRRVGRRKFVVVALYETTRRVCAHTRGTTSRWST